MLSCEIAEACAVSCLLRLKDKIPQDTNAAGVAVNYFIVKGHIEFLADLLSTDKASVFCVK